ncbi:MbtH family protein [Amycolatopsis sp. PS_44_ISF1]|uniref:MbtH family protein n=1 Tax=Amycolatopsis sp. PS_44_ISF1 TaxID=2974917 RepID=UPI0028E03D47|nr:MbtH family protein [Amycolatopsis sp. PS_44_ISF1]MDT8913186.1 MbtH family protein [Amycolatopsis sp. PS_44_ISF1]
MRGTLPVFEDDDQRDYVVVRNDEGQYSIWPGDRDRPEGWAAVGGPQPKSACLAQIEVLWTDLRPKSARS